MQRLMIPNDYLAGIELLRHEYLAAVLELNSACGLSKAQQDLLRAELRKEHRLHCAQEWSAISSQMRADLLGGVDRLHPDPEGRRV
jgi:hypothetical protein